MFPVESWGIPLSLLTACAPSGQRWGSGLHHSRDPSWVWSGGARVPGGARAGGRGPPTARPLDGGGQGGRKGLIRREGTKGDPSPLLRVGNWSPSSECEDPGYLDIGRLWGRGIMGGGCGGRFSIAEGDPKGACCFLPGTPTRTAHGGSPPRHRHFCPFSRVCPTWGPQAPGQRWPPLPSRWGNRVWTDHLVPAHQPELQLCPAPWKCLSLSAFFLFPQGELEGSGWHQPWTGGGGGQCSHWLGPREAVERRGLLWELPCWGWSWPWVTRCWGPVSSLSLWACLSGPREKYVGPPHRRGSASRGTVPWERGHQVGASPQHSNGQPDGEDKVMF